MKDGLFQQIIANPEAFVALFAFGISMISLVFSIWQLSVQRTHNKKSVRPIANFAFGNYEKELYAKIENNGLGPLILKKVRFVKNGVEKNNIIDWLSIERFNNFVTEFENRTISPEKNLIIFHRSFGTEPEEQKARQQMKMELTGIEGIIEYEDIYGKKFEERRSFSWLGRNFMEERAVLFKDIRSGDLA